MSNYDFSGWATRNDLKCSDGRIIRKDAFKHNDGQTVPLVWNHDHTDPYRIVGHALLENRPEGVLAHGKFNDTDLGKTAKIYVEHGDIRHLSIYANQLQQQGPNVMHGAICEVSLVMKGANPGAYITSVMKHGEESTEEGIIYTDEVIELYHSEDEETEEVLQHAEEKKEDKPMVAAVVDEMTRKFLTKTARTQCQSITFFRDPFSLVPVNDIAEIADKFTRNEIMTSNEIRQVIGMMPSDDPKADQLVNSNISQPTDSKENVQDDHDESIEEGEIQNE